MVLNWTTKALYLYLIVETLPSPFLLHCCTITYPLKIFTLIIMSSNTSQIFLRNHQLNKLRTLERRQLKPHIYFTTTIDTDTVFSYVGYRYVTLPVCITPVPGGARLPGNLISSLQGELDNSFFV